MKRAILIGGGLGGLAAALRLQLQGWRVTIFEASHTFGGKMNRWIAGGYTFDTGPSLITMPWVFENLFQAAGSQLSDHVDLVPLNSLAEYFYDDGTRFRYSSSLPEWFRTLERIAPEDQDGFLRFLQLGSRIWKLSERNFLKRTPYGAPRREDLGSWRDFPLRRAWGRYHRTVEAFFKSPYLRQLFNRYPTYVGSSPYASPATLAIIPFLEFAFGGWYVRGGLYAIVEALVGLCQKVGIELRSDARVTQIHCERGRANGVTLLDGERCSCDIVVMNGDAEATAPLLGLDAQPSRSRSMSGFVMLLGINQRLPDSEPHSVYFSADYAKEFSQIFEEKRFPEDPTVYVNVPSRLDRSVAPEGGETLFVMANAPAQSRGWDEDAVRCAKQSVLRRLARSGFPDISRNVVVENIWTPHTIEQRYLMPGGAIYGANSHGWRNAFLRPPNKSRLRDGLYHVGGSTHPGGGTPIVLLSAEITCSLIEKCERA